MTELALGRLGGVGNRISGELARVRDRVSRYAPSDVGYRLSAKAFWPLVLACLVVVIIVPQLGSTVWTLRVQQGLYFGLWALSLNLLVGTTGLISFGHAMFVSFGAYTMAIPFRDHGLDPMWLLFLTPLAGAAGALLVGLVVLRGKLLFFSLLTLGMAQFFWAMEHGWLSLTGGTNGIGGVISPGVFNAFTSPNNLYYLILGVTVVSAVAIYVITKSPFGDALRAIRDNPRRAEFTGMWVKRYEYLAFVIAGMFAGLGGGLFVLSDTSLTASTLDWNKSTLILIAVLVGGMRYFVGPMIGGFFWIVFFDEVHQATGALGRMWDVLLGGIILAIALLFPGGIVGGVHTLMAYAVDLGRRLAGKSVPGAGDDVVVDQELHLPGTVAEVTKERVIGGPILEITGLTKRFGGLVAVDGATLTVNRRTIHAVIGPNGAGKSTLFNLITGLHKPDSGRVVLDGEDVTGKQSWRLIKRGMGRSFQTTTLFWTLPSLLNVRVAGSAVKDHTFKLFGQHPHEVRSRSTGLLDRIGLGAFADLPAQQLSHGDQRSLEIATALAVDANILLLDEPTAGLSPAETKTAVEMIKSLQREHDLTVLFVEHDMDVVFGIADRVTVMHRGAVLAEGTPEEIRRDPRVREAYLGDDHALDDA